MFKKVINYTDYNGMERSEDFYFNISEAEAMSREVSTAGGYIEMIQRAIKATDHVVLESVFKELILDSYGEKSADGKYFYKEDAEGHRLSNKFKQTPAYSVLYMELALNAESASEFVSKVFPKIDPEKLQAAQEAAANGNVSMLQPAN